MKKRAYECHHGCSVEATLDVIGSKLIEKKSHTTRQSLEIYSRLSLADAQPSYNQAMERFPIQ